MAHICKPDAGLTEGRNMSESHITVECFMDNIWRQLSKLQLKVPDMPQYIGGAADK